MPFYADWSVEFEEDVVSCGGGDGPEEVLSQVGLLQSVALVHLWDKSQTRELYCIVVTLSFQIHPQNESEILDSPSLKWKPQLADWRASCAAGASGSPCPAGCRAETNGSTQEVAWAIAENSCREAWDSLWAFGSFQREKNEVPRVGRGTDGIARAGWTSAARSVSWKKKKKAGVEGELVSHFLIIGWQRAVKTYRIFLRIADFDPENVVQQPVNGLLLVEHEDELHNEVQVWSLEHLPWGNIEWKLHQSTTNQTPKLKNVIIHHLTKKKCKHKIPSTMFTFNNLGQYFHWAWIQKFLTTTFERPFSQSSYFNQLTVLISRCREKTLSIDRQLNGSYRWSPAERTPGSSSPPRRAAEQSSSWWQSSWAWPRCRPPAEEGDETTCRGDGDG